jgi:hypothetical protein
LWSNSETPLRRHPWGSTEGLNDVGSRRRGKCQTACKPGSVRLSTRQDDHSSGTHLTMRLTRPTRAAGRKHPRNYHVFCNRDITAAPIRSCSRWGLPCRPCCQRRGALLPHRFALARGTGLLTPACLAQAVCFLWHYPWGRPRRPLAGTVFPWSPDFPLPTGLPRPQRSSSCLAGGVCAAALSRSSCPADRRATGCKTPFRRKFFHRSLDFSGPSG